MFLHHYLPRDRFSPLSLVASLGWSGVDLFFVLSGFLITGILYDTRQSESFFKAFYMRRILRLFPVYFVAVAVVAIGTDFFKNFRTWLNVPFFLYGANIVRVLPHGYTVFPPYFNCMHFWSLAVEEQFYSIWPVIVFLIPDRRKLMQICFAGFAVALAVRIGLVALGASPWTNNYELPARMDTLLAGALLALVVRGPNRLQWLSPRRMWWLVAIGSAMLVPLVIDARSLFPTSIPIITVGFSVLAAIYTGILGLTLIPGTLPNRIGANSVLRFFGRYSYGFYIWHYLCNPICTKWAGAFERVIHPSFFAHMAYILSLLTLFTACSVVSYHLLEVRFLRMKSRFVAKQEPPLNIAPELVPAPEVGT